MPQRKSKTKILFIYSSLSSFVRADLEILERHFNVKKMEITTFRVTKKGGDPLIFLRLFKAVVWSDVVFCWFANMSAFFSIVFCLLLRKASLVVVGGYDAAYVPEIDYGVFVNRWRRVLTRFVYKHVDKVLVVDASLTKDIVRNAHLKIENKIKVVPTGYNSEKWKPSDGERENLVITVGGVDWSALKRKGLETFVKAAVYLPDAKFVLIGKYLDDSVHYLRSVSASNMFFTGFVSDDKLIRFYQKAKVYCQLSRHEGLPTSLCEAMLCGCVPVGTNYYGIQTAIGDTGFYVPYGDARATAEGIKKALKEGAERREAARERIKNMLPLKRRENELVFHINELTEPSRVLS